MDFSESRQGNMIEVSVTNFEEQAFFILRTHGEKVTAVEGGTFLELEEDAWLIGANAKKIAITLENEHSLRYYY